MFREVNMFDDRYNPASSKYFPPQPPAKPVKEKKDEK